MDNPKFLEDLVSRVRQVFSESPAADVEKNLRAVLTNFFNRLDLVTREEFEVQEAVLQRTREKLARLEARVEKLEAAAGGKDTGGSHD